MKIKKSVRLKRRALVVFTKVLTPEEALEFFGGNEGKHILDYITKKGFGSREYLVDNRWLSEPRGRVSGSRYNLAQVFEEVENIADIWKYLKEKSVQKPEKPDKILKQLADARLKQERVRIFTPWGPRYNNNVSQVSGSDPEIATLKEIRTFFDKLNEKNFKIEFILMPADTYGTEINSLPEEFVEEYFGNLEEAARKILGESMDIAIIVKPWSAIKEESKESYKDLEEQFGSNLPEYIGEGEYERALRVSKIFSPENVRESAKRYCIERLIEGNIIQEKYDPIKLSLVRKEKDALDGPLKRLYIIQNKAPWMRG